MNRRHIYLAALLVLPSLAVAQRPGASRATKRDPDMFKDDDSPQGPALRPRDVEDISPIKLLIDKRKDLKLTDAQLDGIKKGESALKDKNSPFLKAIDSLVHELKPPMNRTPESDARMRDSRIALQAALKSIDENYDAAAKDAVGTLDADQQAKANEMLAKLKEDGDKRIRERMAPGGRRGGGGPTA